MARLFPGAIADNHGWSSAREYWQTVGLGLSDRRLQPMAAGHSEGFGADGGFFVPPQFLAPLMDAALEQEAHHVGDIDCMSQRHPHPQGVHLPDELRGVAQVGNGAGFGNFKTHPATNLRTGRFQKLQRPAVKGLVAHRLARQVDADVAYRLQWQIMPVLALTGTFRFNQFDQSGGGFAYFPYVQGAPLPPNFAFITDDDIGVVNVANGQQGQQYVFTLGTGYDLTEKVSLGINYSLAIRDTTNQAIGDVVFGSYLTQSIVLSLAYKF